MEVPRDISNLSIGTASLASETDTMVGQGRSRESHMAGAKQMFSSSLFFS